MRKPCYIVVVLFMTLMQVACSPSHPLVQPVSEKKDVVVGFSQIGAESSWRTAHTESIKSAAAEAGIQLMLEEAQQKQEMQIDAIRSFIAYRVDVIAFTPIVESGWDNVLHEAKEAGIPVILSDRRVQTDDPSLITCYVGTDIIQEGRDAASFLIRKANGKELNVIEITGTENSTSAIDRSKGFREIIGKHPNLKIIDSISGDFMRSKGREAMGKMLNAHPNIDAVFCHNDGMALGAINAIEKHGLRPGKDILLISCDGEEEAISAVKQGKINCVVECNPMLGPAIMDCALKLARGEAVEREYYAPERIFTEDDDLTTLPPRGY